MKFGIFDHIDDAGVPLGQLYAERLTIAEAYDRAGFYGYHVAEHHIDAARRRGLARADFSALAQRTKNLRFGPLVYLLPFYHPLRLIEEVCMLDQMSGGRFQLGVGRGVSLYETAAYGLDFAKTQAMYHEAFQVLLKGLASDELTFDGKYYNFDKLPMVLRPVQRPHPPLWYGVDAAATTPTWPAENHVNIVALGLRDNTTRHRQGLSRGTRAKHGYDPDGTLIGAQPARRGGRHRRGGAGDRAARLSALAGKLPLAVRPPRHRAARDRHLSADLRRADGARQRLSLARLRPCAASSQHEIAANNCNYFVPQMVFGVMTLPEALRSIELFAQGDHAGVRELDRG